MNSPDKSRSLFSNDPGLEPLLSTDAGLPASAASDFFPLASDAACPEAERDAILALALTAGVGSVTFHRLLQEFGSAQRTLGASVHELRDIPGVGPVVAAAVRQQALAADHVIGLVKQQCEADSQQWLTYRDELYPRSLLQTTDPSPVLFFKGDAGLLQSRCVAIVGTRHATRYGAKQAERLASELCSIGITVVSGLARGIDAVAHRAVLQHPGKTIAVLGGGLEKVHPAENRRLAKQIVEQGLVVGEHAPGVPPRGGVFPQRNRVIAGLSLGVIVVEAGARSGALITARHAVEQNRDVFAVPGPVDSAVSRGCHQLLKDGAGVIESIDDLNELLGRVYKTDQGSSGISTLKMADLNLNPQEQQIYSAVNQNEVLIDAIVEATGLPVSRVMATIGALETRGILKRLSGARIARAH